MSSPNDLVLGCYELAHFYSVDPRVFLEQTVSQLNRHLYWTKKLNERLRARQEADAPSEH